MYLWADRRLPAGWRVLSAAGTDTDVFSSHSTRAVSCSALAEKGVALSTTMTAAGWSSDRTFTTWQEAEQGNLWSTCLRPVFEQVTFTSCVRRRWQVYQMYLLLHVISLHRNGWTEMTCSSLRMIDVSCSLHVLKSHVTSRDFVWLKQEVNNSYNIKLGLR